MKYKVTWDETIRHEATVEAPNPQAAEDIVCSGMDGVEDHETNSEFNGVTEVVEVTEIPTISTKRDFCIPVTYTIKGWVTVRAENVEEARKTADADSVYVEDIQDPTSSVELHLAFTKKRKSDD